MLLLGTCNRQSAPEGEIWAKTPIIIVTIDTLRADHLGSYGYPRPTSPNLDRLAQVGVLFENVVTPISFTLPAHVSLWTSRFPMETGITSNTKKLDPAAGPFRFFAKMLAELGYQTAAFVSATPVKDATGIATGFQVWDEPEGKERKGHDTTARVLSWLDSNPRVPFFLWVHYFDPHDPYRPPNSFKPTLSADSELVDFLTAKGLPDPLDPKVLRLNNRYDGEVQFVDSQVGRLIEKLDDLGLLAESTFVVTSDHGEGLGQHGMMGHGEIHNEQIFIPLIIRFPDSFELHGTRVSQVVSLVDVVPTLVDILNLPLQQADRRQFSGNSAYGRRPGGDFTIAQRVVGKQPEKWGPGERYALIGSQWKYLFNTALPDELFDIRDDPGEISNLLEAHPEVAAELRERLLSEIARYSAPSGEEVSEALEEVSPEVLEELRALGYID